MEIWKYVLLLVTKVNVLLLMTGLASTSQTDERLVRHLFRNYNKHIRPARRIGDATNVTFYLTLLQLIGIAEKSEEMTTSQYVTVIWDDPRLSWKPEEFDHVTQIRLPSKYFWKPDIALYNNNDGEYDTTVPVNVLLNYTGKIEWLPAALYKSACKIKVDFFPFDWQNCSMKFKSFAYDKSELFIKSAYDKVVVDKEAYRDSGEWTIIHCPIKTNEDPHDPSYQDITLHLIIQRKPLFYVINIIVPSVLISSLCILVFYLPSGSSEKMTMGISVLLGLTVYLLLLAKRVPETVGVPLIGAYLLFTMLTVTLSITLSIVVLNIYHCTSSTPDMPEWVSTVFMETLPGWLGMERPLGSRHALLAHSEQHKFSATNTGEYHDVSGYCCDDVTTTEHHKSPKSEENTWSDSGFVDHREGDAKLEEVSVTCSRHSKFTGDHTANNTRNTLRKKSGKRPICDNYKPYSKRESIVDCDVARMYMRSSENGNYRTNKPKLKVGERYSLSNIDPYTKSVNTSGVKSYTCTTRNDVSKAQLPRHTDTCSVEKRCELREKSLPASALDRPRRRVTEIKCNADARLYKGHDTKLRRHRHTVHADLFRENRSKLKRHQTQNISSSSKRTSDSINYSAPNERVNYMLPSTDAIKTSGNRVRRPRSRSDVLDQTRPRSRSGAVSTSRRRKPRSLTPSSTSDDSESDEAVFCTSQPRSSALSYSPNVGKYSEEIILAASAVEYISANMKNIDRKKVVVEDWHFLANVIDRMLLFTFFAIFLIGTTHFVLKAFFNSPPSTPFQDGDNKYSRCD